MDERTCKALEDSIAHWKQIANAKRVGDASLTAADCELCREFRNKANASCDECPVRKRTGALHCAETPYRAAIEAHIRWACAPWDERYADAFRAVAREELAFLESLKEAPAA
jgi:hypothetical protein